MSIDMITNTVQIFISYKDEHRRICSDILKPIQTGCALADHMYDGMLRDNAGENISHLNPIYNELTAQYWVWKNYTKIGNPNYVGFMHYRRHLLFNTDKNLPKERWICAQSPFFRYSYMDEDYMEYLDTEHIYQAIEGVDCVLPKVLDYRNFVFKNLIDDYRNLGQQSLDHFYSLFDIIKALYPTYREVADKVRNGSRKYVANMFVMSKQLFFEYCEFLFAIEEEILSQIDFSNMSRQAMRVGGYLGELLLTVFVEQKKVEGKYKFRELNASYIENCDTQELMPAFPDNNTVVGVSSSNHYVPYLSVYLQSIQQVASLSNNYDIIVFQRDITEENKERLRSCIKSKNISLRFINPEPYLRQYNLKFPAHYNLECYFRLTSPILLKNFDKILYTDADLIFMEDPARLYKTDISGYPLCACKDLMWGMMLNIPSARNWLGYAENILKLERPYEYFNTGVMVINIREFRMNDYAKKILELASRTTFRILEQDALNSFFQTSIKYLDTAWNVPILHREFKKTIRYMPFTLEKQYFVNKKSPFVIHFAGGFKPWQYPDEDCAEIWWNYAKKTSYYEIILHRLIEFNISKTPDREDVIKFRKEFSDIHFPNLHWHFTQIDNNFKCIYAMLHPITFRMKKIRYKILAALSFGERHSKYQRKYDSLKSLLKNVTVLKKHMKN